MRPSYLATPSGSGSLVSSVVLGTSPFQGWLWSDGISFLADGVMPLDGHQSGDGDEVLVMHGSPGFCTRRTDAWGV